MNKLFAGFILALLSFPAFANPPPVFPGGTPGQIQYNNAGAFGGLAAVPVANGGTGQTTASGGLAALQGLKAWPDLRPPTLGDSTTTGYVAGNIWYYGKKFWISQTVASGTPDWEVQPLPISAPMGDLVPGALSLYGVMRMKMSYTGYAFELTRASDSTILDVPFDVTGIASWSAVDAFCLNTTCGIDKWFDQSGNGYDLTQTTQASMPQIQGGYVGSMRSITFDGRSVTRQLQNTTEPFTNRQNFSALIIGRMSLSGANNGNTYFNLGYPTNSMFVWSDSNANGVKWYTGGGVQFNTIAYSSDNVTLFVDNAGTFTFQQNNQIFTSGTTVSSGAATGLEIGNTSVIAAPTKMEAIAFAFYNSALSAANQTTLLESAYQTIAVPPQINDQMIMKGDSILGQTTTNPSFESADFCQQITLTLPRKLNTECVSSPNELLAAMASTDVPTLLTFTKKTNALNIMFVEGGTNDLAANDTTSNIIGYYTTICNSAHTAGFKCVVSTILPRTGSLSNGQTAGAFETERQTINAALRAGVPATYDAVNDMGGDPIMGPAGANSNSTYYVDGIHPTSPLGSSYLAASAQRGIAGLLQ